MIPIRHFDISKKRADAQRGTTLIEFLVSTLIFAFGILGLLGMQTKALGNSQASLYRTQAVAFSEDILDRMRLDRQNAIDGSWTTNLSDQKSTYAGGTTLAARELADWKGSLESILPGGVASISLSAEVVTIFIRWDERGDQVFFSTISAL